MSLYPILEFDDNDDVYTKPHVRVDGLVPIENLVITFFKEVLNTLIETAQVEPYIHVNYPPLNRSGGFLSKPV